jgi:hypothetical protein
MKPNISLFNIVKSLSKSEKRYFRMFASLQGGDKNYIKLFDIIDNMKDYDEKYVKEIFKNEKFIRQLTFTKNYLYNLILKSLYQYNSTNSVDYQMNELLFRCNYFYKKTLQKELRESIFAGKKLSLEHERFEYYLLFISFEKIQPLETNPHNSSVNSQEELVIEKLSNLSVYNSYVSMISGIYREEGRTRDKILFNYIERIKKSPLLLHEDYALSVLAKERYYYVLQLISDIYGDLESMYQNCKKRLELITHFPKPFIDSAFNYWQDILILLIIYTIRNDKSKKMIDYLHLLEDHSSDSPADKINIFLIQSILSVNLILKEKKWNKITDLLIRIELGLGKYSGLMDSNYEIVLYDLISRMFVESGNFQSALKFINLLLNHKYISIRRDIEYNARLLNLIIHYELKNYEYLEYLIISTYRYFYKRKKVYKLETLVLNFIKRLPKMESDIDLKENFAILQKELEAIYNVHHEKNIFLYFDYLEWINKKIS